MNLAALFSRLVTICATRTGSADTTSSSPGKVTDSACDICSIIGRLASMASATAGASDTRSGFRSITPRLRRDKSSRSSMSRTMCVTWRSISSRVRAIFTGSPAAMLWILSALRIGASGLRSSCASVARNSSFILLASASSALTWVRRSSLARSTASAVARSTAVRVRAATSWMKASSSGRHGRTLSSLTNSTATRRPRSITGTLTKARAWRASSAPAAPAVRGSTRTSAMAMSSPDRRLSMKVP